MNETVEQSEKPKRRRFAIYIDSGNDLSQEVWEWFTKERASWLELRRLEDPYTDMPHWSNFVAEMTREITEGENLPWHKDGKDKALPDYGEDWTRFFADVDMQAILDRIVQREIMQLIRSALNCTEPEPKCLCKCAGCRNFVMRRIKL